MADREVNLKLGTELKTGGDEALRKIGQTAGDAARCGEDLQKVLYSISAVAEKTGKTFTDLGRNGAQALASMSQRAQETEKALRNVAAQAAKGYQGIGSQDVLRRAGAFRQAAGFVGSATGQIAGGVASHAGFGGLGGIGSMAPAAAAATAALWGFTQAIKAAAKANEMHYRALEYNPQSGLQEENPVTMARERQKELRKPGWWNLWGATTQNEEAYRRGAGFQATRENYERYLRHGLYHDSPGGQDKLLDQNPSLFARFRRFMKPESERQREEAARRANMSFEQFQQRFGKADVQKDIDIFNARLGIGVAGREAAARQQRNSALFEQEQQRILMESKVQDSLGLRREGFTISQGAATTRGIAIEQMGKNAAYNRGEQIEDVSRQIALREGLLRIQSQGSHDLGTIQAQYQAASKQTGDRSKELEATKAQERTARASLEAAKAQNLGSDEILRRSDEVLAATERRKVAEESLMEASRKTVELQKAGTEAVLRMDEQRHHLLVSNYEAVKRAEQAQTQKRLDTTEKLGLEHPRTTMTLLGLAKKAQMGMPLTQRDIGLMGQHRDLFGNVLQRLGMQRGAGIYQQFQQFGVLGLGNREQALHQQAAQLKNQIDVKLNFDTAKLTDDLAKKVIPEMNKIATMIQQRLEEDIGRIGFEAWVRRKNQFRGQTQ